jgi:hypothetical protein
MDNLNTNNPYNNLTHDELLVLASYYVDKLEKTINNIVNTIKKNNNKS